MHPNEALANLIVLLAARPAPLVLFAGGGDLDPLSLDRKPQAPADLGLELFQFRALKLHYLLAILANDVVVVRVLRVIRVVKLMILSEIYFFYQPALHQQRQCPVNRSSGDLLVLAA